MALPGQTFTRVLILLLDCGRTMQQPYDPVSTDDSSSTARRTPFLHSEKETGSETAHPAARVPDSATADTFAAAAVAAAKAAIPLDLLEACVLRYLENLAVGSARVDVGIIAYGSPHTNNHLAPDGEQSEGYLNVEELLAPCPISWHAAHVVEHHFQKIKATKGANKSDWIDAVVVGADLLERTYGGKLLQHEVFFLLFSDLKEPPSSEEDLEPVHEHLKKLDVQLISVLIDYPNSQRWLPPVLLPMGEKGLLQSTESLHDVQQQEQEQEQQQYYYHHHQMQQQRHGQHQSQQQDEHEERQQEKEYLEHKHPGLRPLWRCVAAIIPWSSFCSSPALRYPSLLRSRRLTTKCRVPLKISSSFSLPVLVFLQTKRESLPPLKKRIFVGSNRSTATAKTSDQGRAPLRRGASKRHRSSGRDIHAAEQEEEEEDDDNDDTKGGEEGLDDIDAARQRGRKKDVTYTEKRDKTDGDDADADADEDDVDAKKEETKKEEEEKGGWRDVRVERYYYRAQDPNRRPVLLSTDKGISYQFTDADYHHAALHENVAEGPPSGGRHYNEEDHHEYTRAKHDEEATEEEAAAAEAAAAEAAAGAASGLLLVKEEEEKEHVKRDFVPQKPRQKLVGYRFGRDLVVISSLEQQVLKQSHRPAAIEALGVVKQTIIKRWWITGNSEYVTSVLKNVSAFLALRALVLALQRLSAVLLCSVTWREGQPARPAALFPHTYTGKTTDDESQRSWWWWPFIASCINASGESIKINPPIGRRFEVEKDVRVEKSREIKKEEEEQQRCYGFHLVYLPYAEDMQMLRFPSLRSVSSAQLQAVEALVTLLTLPTPPLGVVSAATASPSDSPSALRDMNRAPTLGAATAATARETEKATLKTEKVVQHRLVTVPEDKIFDAASKAAADAASTCRTTCSAVLLEQRAANNSSSHKGDGSSMMYASLPNPAIEIWTPCHPPCVNLSPPCSSTSYSTFLPPVFSYSFSSLSEYADLQRIPSPALERFCALLAYRHYNRPLTTPPAARRLLAAFKDCYRSRINITSTTTEKERRRASAIQQQLLYVLWPPEYSFATHSFHTSPSAPPTPEALFNWGVHTSHWTGRKDTRETAGAAATEALGALTEKGDKREISGSFSQKEAAKELLFAAFPLGTCAAAQQSLKERRAEGKQQLWGEVDQKQQRLQAPVKRLLLKDVRLPPEADEAAEREEATAAAGRGASAVEGEIHSAETTSEKERKHDREEAAERAAEREDRKERIALLEKQLHVKSINPVGDFNRMLQVREVDLTEKAIEEMIAMIYRFLEAAKKRDTATGSYEGIVASAYTGQQQQQQQLLGKAFACVAALRDGCRRELEGARFNAFLRSLKAAACAEEKQRDVAVGATTTAEEKNTGQKDHPSVEEEGRDGAKARTAISVFSTFFKWLKEAEVPLITTNEDPRAGVACDDALSIYSEATVAPGEMHRAPHDEEDEITTGFSAEEQELLNLVE